MKKSSDLLERQSTAAESAENSSTSKKHQKGSPKRAQQSARTSAAKGDDNSQQAGLEALSHIPPRLLATFKAIPAGKGGVHPAFLSMTSSEQEFMGKKLGLQRNAWRLLVKSPVLAFPQTTYCQHWMNWAVATNNLPDGSGCMMMNPSEALTQPDGLGPECQDDHIKKHGYPMAVWRWIVAPDWDEDTLDSGFTLVSPSASS